MVGKSKDNKANKGRKALENEWELALAAANNNDRLIASSSNVETSKLLHTQKDDDNSGYVKHRIGASARERAKIFNNLTEKDEVDTNNDDSITQKFANSIDITDDMDEETKKKAILKAKKKAEKEAKLEFERKEKENIEKRREEKRKKEEELQKL